MLMLPVVISCIICFPLTFMLVSSADVRAVNAKISATSIFITQWREMGFQQRCTVNFNRGVILPNGYRNGCHGSY